MNQTSTSKNKIDIEAILKKVITYLPFASLLILIAGILPLKIYYNSFDINIIKFIDLSEVIVLFIDGLIAYSIFSLFILVSGFGFNYLRYELKFVFRLVLVIFTIACLLRSILFPKSIPNIIHFY